MSYECLGCNRTFSSLLGAQSHSRAKGHSLPECKQCERIFVNENAMRNHLDNALVHRNHCFDCNRDFTTRDGYEQHLAFSSAHRVDSDEDEDDEVDSDEDEYDEVDSDEDEYDEVDSDDDDGPGDEYDDGDSSDAEQETFCRSCDRNFVNNSALNQHLAFNPAHNWCFVCSRDFPSQQALAQHNASPAHKDRVFKCPFCSNMFKTPSSIAMHIESGCHRVNRRQVTAAVHSLNIVPQISITRRLEGPINPPTRLVRYFANERAFNGHGYECYLCHDTFRTLDSLNQHLNSPTHDDTEFRCPHCGSEFQLISGLIQHIESESCGIARFKEVTRQFEALTDQFRRLLKF